MAILQQQHAHGRLVYPSDTETLQQNLNTSNRATCLYVGVGGDVRVLTVGGDDVTFAGVPSGSFMPVWVIKVFATGTTASNILAVDMGQSEASICYSTELWQNIDILWENWDTFWNNCNN
jgi:hypothetical protein